MEDFFTDFKKSTSPIGYYLFLYIYPISILFTIMYSLNKNTFESLETTISILILFVISTYDDFWKNEIFIKAKQLNYISEKSTAGLIYLIFLTFFGLVLLTRLQASNIIYGRVKSLPQLVIILDNDTIKTNEVYRYIGRTKNYVFIYNTKKGCSYSYDISNIKFFSLKESNPHMN